ncbi:MAG: M48 family metallopeptidase [Saprospiraceae bacterium]|nr:M48 family metallopeptidase [Saprospiraceae bacterium]
MTFTLGDIDIELTQKEIKNIHLSVMPPDGHVRIAAPLNLSAETIRLYAISKLSWIKKQQKKIRSQQRESNRLFINKETHYYQGRKYMLKIVPTTGVPKIILNKSTIVMHISENSTPEKRQEVMNEWYRAQLKNIVEKMISVWESKIGVTAIAWRIRSMKTKWGSCNTDHKSILLNLELAKKPLHCIEYIIVHELIHLIERRHNDRFISLLDHYLPNWRHYKEELNKLPVSHPGWEY